MTGKKVCQVHGGKSLSGIASPRYKTGRYSKALPTRMRDAYTAALSDPQLLEQREQIGIVDARILDLLTRVDTGESGALWSALKQARTDLLSARRVDDRAKQAEALNTLLTLIDEGHADYRAWHEVGSALEQRRRLVESERKRMVEMRAVITSEQAMVLISALLESVHRNVADRAALAAVQADFLRLTTHDRTIIDA